MTDKESVKIEIILHTDKTVEEALEELVRILPAEHYEIKKLHADTHVIFSINPRPKTNYDGPT